MTFAAFFLGVSIYGPCSLYGVAAIEAVPNGVSGSSHTIVAFAANSKKMRDPLTRFYMQPTWQQILNAEHHLHVAALVFSKRLSKYMYPEPP